MISRRSFLRVLGACAGLGVGTGYYTFQIEPNWLEIVRRPIPIPRLPPTLIGRTLAHLSDIHVSPLVSDDFLLEVFRRVSELRPDIVVITGDLMSLHDGWRDHAARIYQHVPRGRLATIATLGNHDYGRGGRIRRWQRASSTSCARVASRCSATRCSMQTVCRSSVSTTCGPGASMRRARSAIST
jgi:predicted MPP superfamily phosphohydrolase